MGDLMHCDEHSGLMEALDAIKADTSKIPQLDIRMAVHEAKHEARAKMLDSAAKVAKIASIIIAGLGALVGAGLAIAAIGGV